MNVQTSWGKALINVTGLKFPFELSTERAVQIVLNSTSLSPSETRLVQDQDLVPAYVRWWLTVGERLYLDYGRPVALSVKKARRWGSPQYVVAEFTFCDLLTLLSDPQFEWGLGWGDAAVSPFRCDGCIIPQLPYGSIVAGTEEAVHFFMSKCCPE